ncbi:LLM class flavin-dependent oxidoreductase [Nonomuraea longicatena]|uniref:LLM class flavin-dependent oxidoreductase n=1 Tax=Nonomuraea longicatena TaxID=83682 RepID=A0ABP3YZE6_9ACTN
MHNHAFRFGVVAGSAPGPGGWPGLARRVEELGYATLLIPDTLQTLSPFAAAAAAAAATSTLRVGTYVVAAPNRTPAMVAWETETVQTLSGGRFELGLGAGRPGAEQEAAALGVPFGTAARRVGLVAEIAKAVKNTPILIAASGTRMLRLAAEQADTVALALPPHATEAELAATLDELYEIAGDRFPKLEVNSNLFVVGDDAPDWLVRSLGRDPREIVARGGYGVVPGEPAAIADTLAGRRDRLGISYVTVGAPFAERFAPVVERLVGT